MLDRIEFLITEALVSMRRNLWMTFAAVSTSAMALFLLGGLGFVYMGFVKFVANLGEKVEMKAFVKDDISDSQAKALQDRILKIQGVASVRFVSRDDGLKQFLKENPNIDIKGLELDNPLPNSYVVRVRDLSAFKLVAQTIQGMKEIEPDGVKFPTAEKDFLSDAMKTIPWLGLTLGGLMLITSGILIYNAIRLTILARRREIKIMQLVGATRFMVWTPILLEGIVQGLFGGAIAAFVLAFAYRIVKTAIVRNLSAFANISPFPLTTALLVLGIAGGIYGLICSAIAVREPLKLKRGAV